MARYSHKGHDTIWYDITQNIAIRYDMIPSESASPYVRTTIKQATAHNTGAPSFCLSTLSLLQVLGYWPTSEATVVDDLRGDGRRAAGVPWSPGLLSRATVSTGRHCLAVARLKYLVIAQSLNIWAMPPPSQSTHWPTREAGQLLPISVTLPASATLLETPFVDVADGIDGIDADGDWELCRISTLLEG